jgi:hypothetical protein
LLRERFGDAEASTECRLEKAMLAWSICTPCFRSGRARGVVSRRGRGCAGCNAVFAWSIVTFVVESYWNSFGDPARSNSASSTFACSGYALNPQKFDYGLRPPLRMTVGGDVFLFCREGSAAFFGGDIPLCGAG